ncbi:hypothetical protein HRbin28_02744 [bacterium HR28]|nr:hypothetical protein HRbin28_02744 [bacterium HR28]
MNLRELQNALGITDDQLHYLARVLTRFQQDTHFPHTLREYREKRHLSRYRLARRAGLSPSAITRLEKGQRHPTRTTLAKLTLAMNLTPEETHQLYAAAGYLPLSSPRTTQGTPATPPEKRTTSEYPIPSSLYGARPHT